MNNTDVKISDYERSLNSDADWKGEVEKIVTMLVEDRIEVLKRRTTLE